MDMSPVIVPKSDQINADDLIAGPMTITINKVTVSGGKEQPVSIFFDGSDKAYRPCKSMCRVMVSAWGPDTAKYIGRSLTLFCDPRVKWGGMEVGGIRISHMSDIGSSMTMALTVTRANKKPFTVKPLLATKSAAAQVPEHSGASKEVASPASAADPSNAPAPQGSTGTVSPVPSQEGVGQGVNAGAGAPSDADIVKDIETWVRKHKFDMAYDLCRSIKDLGLSASTKLRIDASKDYALKKSSGAFSSAELGGTGEA